MARIIKPIEKCEKCGRFLRTPASPLREKLEKLADGTRNIRELMKLTGCTRGTIYVALTHMRKQGYPLALKRIQRVVLERAEFDHLTMLHDQEHLSWREIGLLKQVNADALWRHYRNAKLVYEGPAPARSKKKSGRGTTPPETAPATTSECTTSAKMPDCPGA